MVFDMFVCTKDISFKDQMLENETYQLKAHRCRTIQSAPICVYGCKRLTEEIGYIDLKYTFAQHSILREIN